MTSLMFVILFESEMFNEMNNDITAINIKNMTACEVVVNLKIKMFEK